MKKKISVEAALIQSLKDARDFEARKKKLTTRKRELPPPALKFTSKKVKKLREEFGVTQDEFATIMNVKVATVRSCEQGQRRPADASNRLLEILEKQGATNLNNLKWTKEFTKHILSSKKTVLALQRGTELFQELQ